MAKDYYVITVSSKYEVHHAPDGSCVVAVTWRQNNKPIEWVSMCGQRFINLAHDPLNKRVRSWN